MKSLSIYLIIFHSVVFQSVSFSQENFIYDVHMFDSSNVLVLGYDALRRSTDGGYSWLNQIFTNEYYLSFSFINDSVGFASAGDFIKTTNKGITWQTLTLPGYMWDIDFIDENTGYAVINDHYIYKTTTGGNLWTNVLYGGNNPIKCVSFITEERGMISGGSWGIRITSDGGKTWSPSGPSPQWEPNDIWLFNENEGIVVADVVRRTTNFGLSWETMDFPFPFVERRLQDVFFLDSLVGFAVGGHWAWNESSMDSMGAIIATTDGGLTWELQSDQLGHYLFGVHFINRSIGMAVGAWGAIYKTIDGGRNWVLISNPTSVESENNEPEHFYLFQNYPNPFNPSANIEYSLKEGSFVELKVYDVIGRAIVTLVNEFKQPGKYSVNFDASRLPSGVYFYRIIAGSFTDNKKMVLTK